MKGISANFGFLGTHDAQFVRLGGLAERYFKDDTNTCRRELSEDDRTDLTLKAGA